jgi:hypothetical protein
LYPELELFPSEELGRKAMRRAVFKLVGRPAHLATAAAMAVLAVMLTLVLRHVVGGLGLPIGQRTRDLILAVPVIVVCCTLGVWMLKRRISKHLRSELLDCGVPTCARCGYHLVGLPGPECPECGRPFDADVRRTIEAQTAPEKATPVRPAPDRAPR